MTDYVGTEDPAAADEAALRSMAPYVPVASGASGIAAPAVIAATDPLADLPIDSEPLADTAEPHAHDEDGHPGHDEHEIHDGGHSHDIEQQRVIDKVADGVADILEPEGE